MQQLQFEDSWEKALSDQDRLEIERIFLETKDSHIVFAPIREAINHREDLLITVLVHNFTERPLTFHNETLIYRDGNNVIGEYRFTLPSLSIPEKVSMPWTFIFPKGSYIQNVPFEKGIMEFANRKKE